MAINLHPSRSKLTPENIQFVARKDPRKLARIKYMLKKEKELEIDKRNAKTRPEDLTHQVDNL